MSRSLGPVAHVTPQWHPGFHEGNLISAHVIAVWGFAGLAVEKLQVVLVALVLAPLAWRGPARLIVASLVIGNALVAIAVVSNLVQRAVNWWTPAPLSRSKSRVPRLSHMGM